MFLPWLFYMLSMLSPIRIDARAICYAGKSPTIALVLYLEMQLQDLSYMNPEQFLDENDYLISLVDDLTNDVVRKLSTYLLRGGIADTAYSEAVYYFQQQEEKDTKPYA